MTSEPAAELRIGTAGWSYADWYGPFYPGPSKQKGFRELEFYTGHFDAVEVNSSYYRIPSRYLVDGWVARTPDGFVFSVKAFSALTHHFEAAATQTFREFVTAVDPLREAGKLGAVLLQFPPRFQLGPQSIDYLRLLPELLAGLPCVVEFRHRGWVEGSAAGETLDLLRELGLGFCCVDEPQLAGNMPPMAVAAGPIGYVRFHGRNFRDWWPRVSLKRSTQLRREIRRESATHQERRAKEMQLEESLEAQKAQRYNYLYSQAELIPWRDRIQKIAGETRRTFVITNNHFLGQAVTNAKMLQDLLGVPRHGEEPEGVRQLELIAAAEERGGPRPAPQEAASIDG